MTLKLIEPKFFFTLIKVDGFNGIRHDMLQLIIFGQATCLVDPQHVMN